MRARAARAVLVAVLLVVGAACNTEATPTTSRATTATTAATPEVRFTPTASDELPGQVLELVRIVAAMENRIDSLESCVEELNNALRAGVAVEVDEYGEGETDGVYSTYCP